MRSESTTRNSHMNERWSWGKSYPSALAQVRVSRAFLADHILSWFDTFQDLALLLLQTRFYRGILKISKGFFLEDAELLDSMAVELENRLEKGE